MTLLLRTIKSDQNIKVDFTSINQFSMTVSTTEIRSTVFTDVILIVTPER